jgi:hypothetical protein
MRPCMPRQKDSGTCPLNNRTRPGCRPNHTLPTDQPPGPCYHIVSGLALASCRRGVAWSRRCRAYISVGGLLEHVGGHRAYVRNTRATTAGGRGRVVAQVPAGEVLP